MKIKIPEIGIQPKSVHRRPCKLCPTAHFPSDPELDDVIEKCESGEYRPEDCVFRCAWRPEKICWGIAKVTGYRQ